MYHAHAAALQSSCLSRQVGAALMAPDGTVVATGTNDVPKFGGGVYNEESEPDNRCFAWEWTGNGIPFYGCHNQRKKKQLQIEIATWLGDNFSKELAILAHPLPKSGTDTAAKARDEAEKKMRNFFAQNADGMDNMPGVKEIIEYSRSIHAEMNTILSAGRNGVSPSGMMLFCTTYPCHNCARHLVTAGIRSVYYIEPYVKSLATELHSDSIVADKSEQQATGGRVPTRMVIAPFTGVGPRMFEDFFTKRTELKKTDGSYVPPQPGDPIQAVRIRDLQLVEESAADLIPDT